MANYKEMYLTLMKETEQAIRILVEAQRTCEELYCSEESSILRMLPAEEPPSHETAGSRRPNVSGSLV